MKIKFTAITDLLTGVKTQLSVKPRKKENKETPCISLKELSMQLQTEKPLEEIKKEFENK